MASDLRANLLEEGSFGGGGDYTAAYGVIPSTIMAEPPSVVTILHTTASGERKQLFTSIDAEEGRAAVSLRTLSPAMLAAMSSPSADFLQPRVAAIK